MRPVRAGAAALSCAALVACGGSGSPSTTPSGAAQEAVIPGVSTECADPPKASAETVEGLRLPPGAFVTAVRRQDPVVQVLGYVRMTPKAIRAWAEGLTGVTILRVEDEVREAETLFDTGEHRIYIRGTAVCQTESTLSVLVTPNA